ncbi:MAG: bifunctional acetate--CoA ligase family protein/GNAT family N-acetyltransferase [Candidatus Bathyarchaeia archaeon]
MRDTGIEGLDKIFNPKKIAVIGASNKEGSVGFKLFNNLIGVGFRGTVYPVNPFSPSVQGIMAYPSVKKIPWQIDLAIVATPAHVVPQVVEECGESGITGIIIVSSGFGETDPWGKILEEKLVKLKSAYGLRIIGPNCLGVIRPSIKLNATFANKMAMPGQIAFMSQSGALCASVLDWAVHANVGFSCFVSVGGMIDVDFADLIDYFGSDPETRSIVLFIESIKEPRKFMSAARRFAGTKPIIVVKAGKTPEGMKAAASHTGAIAGEDAIYNAFFERAGIVRVEEISDLFNCSEILAMQPPPRGKNLAIITNAGGPGVMATDALIARGGKLATLNDETVRALDEILPHYWSKSNPVDICEDATVYRFRKVLETCVNKLKADGYLVIYTPIGAAEPSETAKVLIETLKDIDKPILACWLGEEEVNEARNLLRKNRIPVYSTPEQAVATFMYMHQYARNLELLYETPEEIPISFPSDKTRLQKILETAAKEEREVLTEAESKGFLEVYGIPTAKAYVAKSIEEAVSVSSKIGFPVVMKILSPQVTHKTDVDGVILNVASASHVKKAFTELVERVKKRNPSLKIEGVTVQPMITNGYELMMGSKRDPQFGSVIIFGTGGTSIELFKDISVSFPPLNQTLARRMIESTRAYKLLSEGFRGRPPINIRLLEETLVKFSQLIIDFPQIKEADVNPLKVDEKSVVALDARIVLDLNKVSAEIQPYEHLIIRPYPKKYVTQSKLRDGREVLLRPIKPEDEPLLVELFKTFSEETMRFRFFQVIKEISHQTLAKYCNIDYDREMVIVAELSDNGKRCLVGMVRLVVEPDGESGEVAVVVGDPWQNRGIGTKMFDYIIEISKDMGLKRIFGEILAENTKIMHICCSRGFEIKSIDEETYLATLNLGRSGS